MLMSSPAKKRCRLDSDDEASFRSDKGVDGEDEHDEYEDGDELRHGKDDLIEPHVMLEYVESFQTFVTERGKMWITVSRMKGLFDEWLAYRQKDSPTHDSEAITKSFKRYFAASIKPTNMSLEICFRNMSEYLIRPDSVLMHPDFPVRPPPLIIYYSKKFGYATSFGKYKEVLEKMKEDEVGRQECERELFELEKTCLKKMEDFLMNNRKVMLPKQMEFVERKIKKFRRKLFPSQRRLKAKQNRQANGSEAKPEKTAFDLFCSTKLDKYVDLPADVRLKKLRKKFEKLSEDKKEIFEKLALIK